MNTPRHWTDGVGDHRNLLIAGSQDPGTPSAGMRLMHERIGGSQYLELDAAHLSNIERAPAFTAALKSFLSAY